MTLGRRWLLVLSIVERPAYGTSVRAQAQPRGSEVDAESVYRQRQSRRALARDQEARELAFLGSGGWWYGLNGPAR